MEDRDENHVMNGQLSDQPSKGADKIAVMKALTEMVGNALNKGMSKPGVRRMEKLVQ